MDRNALPTRFPQDWFEHTAEILRREAEMAERRGKPELSNHLRQRAAALENDRLRLITALA